MGMLICVFLQIFCCLLVCVVLVIVGFALLRVCCAKLFNFNPFLHSLTGNHDFTTLNELFHAVRLVCEHTEVERNKAILYLQKQLKRVLKKLNPLKNSRGVVKEEMGDENWNNNEKLVFEC